MSRPGVGGHGLDVEQVDLGGSEMVALEERTQSLERLVRANGLLAVTLRIIDDTFLALGDFQQRAGDRLLAGEPGDLRRLAVLRAATVHLGELVLADDFVVIVAAVHDDDVFLLDELVLALHLAGAGDVTQRIDLLNADELGLREAVLLDQIRRVDLQGRSLRIHEHDQLDRLGQRAQELLGARAERVFAVAREVEAVEVLVGVAVDRDDDERQQRDLDDDVRANLQAPQETGGARRAGGRSGDGRRFGGSFGGHAGKELRQKSECKSQWGKFGTKSIRRKKIFWLLRSAFRLLRFLHAFHLRNWKMWKVRN